MRDPLLARMPPCEPESELAFLGGCLLDSATFGDLEIAVDPEWFSDAWHAQVWQAMLDLTANDMAVNIVSVHKVIESRKAEGGADGNAYRLASLQEGVPVHEMAEGAASSANVNYYAKRIKDAWISRQLVVIGRRITNMAWETSPIDRRLEDADALLHDAASHNMGAVNIATPAQLMDLVENRLERMRNGERQGVQSGYHGLDDLLRGFQPGELSLLAGRPSMGKELHWDTPVLMRDGSWKRIKDVEVGDAVASPDGARSHVTGHFPQGRKQLFEVRFRDGRTVEAGADHQWLVHSRKWKAPRVLKTSQVQEMLKNPWNQNRLWIDRPSGVWGTSADLPVSPWLLGALLGDGGLSTGAKFSNSCKEVIAGVDEELSEWPGLTRTGDGAKEHRLSAKRGKPNELTRALSSLGLMGKRSVEKFIPGIYLSASRQQRLRLLQGLMDTDGWCEKTGSVCYSTSSSDLARDFQQLCWSLGYWCSTKERDTQYTHKGEKRTGETSHRFFIGDAGKEVFRHEPRKRSRASKPRARQPRVSFSSITDTEIAEATCISVSHHAALYVTKDYIVTHNTALAFSLLRRMAADGQPVGIVSLETPCEQVGINWLAAASRFDSRMLRDGAVPGILPHALVRGIAEIRNCKTLWTADAGINTVVDFRRQARIWKARHGIKLVCIDYLQLLRSGGKQANRREEVSEVSMALKRTAKDLGVHVLALAQLNRKGEDRASKEPVMSDLKESGQLEQDADQIMLIHRPGYYDDNEDPSETIVRVAKNRNGATGVAKLRFAREHNTFEDAPDRHEPQGNRRQGSYTKNQGSYARSAPRGGGNYDPGHD